jgi:hypothetical protein
MTLCHMANHKALMSLQTSTSSSNEVGTSDI